MVSRRQKVNIVVPITELKQLNQLSDAVDIIELRADIMTDPEEVENHTTTPLSYVLKSKSQGGEFDGSLEVRIQKLLKASLIYDYVELEAAHDLIPEILSIIPANKRRIAWYGPSEDFESLTNRVNHYMQTPATCYKLVIQTNAPGEEIPILRLLHADKTDIIVAYGEGKNVAWTQVLAPFIGSTEVHATIENDPTNGLYFTIEKLRDDYNLPFIYSIERVFGIIGNPVCGSISPNKHNASYRELCLPYLYLPFQTSTFCSFFDQVINNKTFPIPISGLTVVAPFKELGLAATQNNSNQKDPMIKHCNGMFKKEGSWNAFSTDAIGAIEALNLIGGRWYQKNIAIIGCGGAGFGIASGLKDLNLSPTLVNRTIHKGLKVAKSLGLSFVPLSVFSPEKYDIIIHCTPIGKKNGETPFDIRRIGKDSIVIDHVYTIGANTALIEHCRLMNIEAYDGKEIARLQISHQFKFLTGIEQPITKIIEEKLKNF